MSTPWDDVTAGFQQAADGLQKTITGLQQAAEASRLAHRDYEDVQESNSELRRVMMEQAQAFAELRAEFYKLRDELGGHS